jgi:hypothetical protein
MKPPGAHDYAQGGGAVLVVVLDDHIAGSAGIESTVYPFVNKEEYQRLF